MESRLEKVRKKRGEKQAILCRPWRGRKSSTTDHTKGSKRLSKSNVEVLNVEGVVFDEFATGLDLVAH